MSAHIQIFFQPVVYKIKYLGNFFFFFWGGGVLPTIIRQVLTLNSSRDLASQTCSCFLTEERQLFRTNRRDEVSFNAFLLTKKQ